MEPELWQLLPLTPVGFEGLVGQGPSIRRTSSARPSSCRQARDRVGRHDDVRVACRAVVDAVVSAVRSGTDLHEPWIEERMPMIETVDPEVDGLAEVLIGAPSNVRFLAGLLIRGGVVRLP